jgi:hypothetical protein
MQYIEPRPASITFNDKIFNGLLSGTTDFVKFSSNDPAFLELFPTGEFDTMFINRGELSQPQQDVIDFAQEMVRFHLRG